MVRRLLKISFFEFDPSISFSLTVLYWLIRRRTRVWALAPKPESVDACFLLFCHIVGSQVMKTNDKKSILSCCPNEVFGEVRSTSVSFAINLCAQLMSYQNQHSLSQPYWNFLPSSLIFYPNEICLIVAFVFIQLTCNNTIRSVCLSERREWKAKHFFHTQKRTYNSQSTTKKQILLTVSNLSLKHMKFA